MVSYLIYMVETHNWNTIYLNRPYALAIGVVNFTKGLHLTHFTPAVILPDVFIISPHMNMFSQTAMSC
jgi:hypothetical protein